MNRSRHKRAAVLAIALLTVLIAAPLAFTWRMIHQDRLNRALIAAIKAGRDQAALTLLKRGADANARDVPPDPRTPWRRLVDLVRGRKIQVERGPSALMLAMDSLELDAPPDKSSSLQLVRALLERKADPNEPDSQEFTPLMYAAVSSRPDLIQVMIAHGGNANVTDDDDDLLLVFKMRSGRTGGYLALPSSRPGGGKSLLMCTCAEGSPECVQALLEAHANVNARDEYGVTALSCAIDRENLAIVKLLLDHHADWRVTDRNGDTLLAQVKSYLSMTQDDQYRAIATLLEQAGAKKYSQAGVRDLAE